MSKSKAQLIIEGREHGIKNAEKIPYTQLSTTVRKLQGKAPLAPRKPWKRPSRANVPGFSRPYRVKLRKGKIRYHYVVIAPNGEPTAVSQRYFSKSNARRAAKAVAVLNNAIYTE